MSETASLLIKSPQPLYPPSSSIPLVVTPRTDRIPPERSKAAEMEGVVGEVGKGREVPGMGGKTLRETWNSCQE